MDCICKGKCNWCGKRKSEAELWTIDIWCKWYGMKMCENCYEKKRENLI